MGTRLDIIASVKANIARKKAASMSGGNDDVNVPVGGRVYVLG